MGSKIRHGDGDDAEILNEDFTDTTAVTTDGDDVRDVDSVGVQLIVDFLHDDPVAGSSSDGVVSGTKTWTLTEYTFTGLTGATIRISGATNTGNNGDFVISSVTSAHVIVTSTASGLVTETFTSALRIEVIHTETAAVPTGDWKVEVSNNFVPATNGTVYGQVTQAGDWTDITDQFSPSIAAVTTAGSQYVQADITARALKYTFTPSDGEGTARVLRFAKSWS